MSLARHGDVTTNPALPPPRTCLSFSIQLSGRHSYQLPVHRAVGDIRESGAAGWSPEGLRVGVLGCGVGEGSPQLTVGIS